MVNTLRFDYYKLELIKSDLELDKKLGEELTKETLDLDEISKVLQLTEKMDKTIAVRKVKHAVENQLASAKEVIREIAVQNTVDAYFDLESFLTKRNEKVHYPLRVDVTTKKKGENTYDLEIRDYATGMTQQDVLYKYFAIGDTSKQDKNYHVGGHGRGAKAGLNHCKQMTVESFGKKTCAKNSDGEYSIEIGESSDVREGTKITLENLVIKEEPLLALKEFAGRISSQFDFRFNGIKVNQKDDSNELGKLPLEETKKIRETQQDLSDLLQASSKQAQGLELKQSVMTIFEKPLDIDYLKRVITLPAGYLLSRSRNEIPKPVQDVLEDRNEKSYKKFFTYLYDNLTKIGAYEFRFMDSFSKRTDTLSKIVIDTYKAAKKTAIAFMIGSLLFFSVENIVKPGIDLAAYYMSKENYFSTKVLSKVHRPVADVHEIISSLFGQSRLFSKIKKRPIGCYSFEHRTGNSTERSYRKDIFFKLTSYNRILPDGSWTNIDDSELMRPRHLYEEKAVTEVFVNLNLDCYKKESILPMPIGYRFGMALTSFEAFPANFPMDKLPRDTYLAGTIKKPEGKYPVQYVVIKAPELIDQFEKQDPEMIKKFTQLPFKIVYPEDLEAKLKRLDEIQISQAKKVKLVASIIKEYLTYNTSKENNIKYMKMDNVVNDPLKSKQVDCDVANGILASILRERYNIPTKLAVGIQGVDGELNLKYGHGVCEAYIRGQGWVELDATPGILSEDMLKTVYNDGPSWYTKLFDWLKSVINPDKKPGQELEEKVVDEYTNLRPEPVGVSDYFRKAMYYGISGAQFLLKNYMYVIPAMTSLGVYAWLRRRKKRNMRNLPVVDTRVKEEDKAYEERITINKGIEYLKKGELSYDQQVNDKSLEDLAKSEIEQGRYVLDYNFYNAITEMSGIKTKKYDASEEEDTKSPITPKLLKNITFGNEIRKKKQDAEKISRYSKNINALQDIVTNICKSNRLSQVKVTAEYEFESKDKMFSFKESSFSPKVYVNLDHKLMEKTPQSLYFDGEVLDSLVFTVALAQNQSIGEISNMKKKYLNNAVLGGQE
ncbi:transglutaminase domain-containing protein [Candidatus Woesearchaeota archaeon]|nr:transglutaminase domain-containing protein [Candidatus Woesearchaeota archaeon]